MEQIGGLRNREKMGNEKCLVHEAMKKCKCEMCKLSRQARDFAVRCQVHAKINKIMIEAIKTSENTTKTKNGTNR